MPGSETETDSSRYARLYRAATVLMLCGCAGMLGIDYYRELRIRQDLVMIQKAGGFYSRNNDSSGRPVISIDLDASVVFDSGEVRQRGPLSDETLRLVGRFSELRELSLAGADFTDSGLVILCGLRVLERINLSGTSISDAGLSHLKKFTSLRVIDVRGTQLSPTGINELRRAFPRAVILADQADR
jgi:hypothetical protein